jgi:hypothetical protein
MSIFGVREITTKYQIYRIALDHHSWETFKVICLFEKL